MTKLYLIEILKVVYVLSITAYIFWVARSFDKYRPRDDRNQPPSRTKD